MRRLIVALCVLLILTGQEPMTQRREPQTMPEVVADLAERVRRVETLLGGGVQSATGIQSLDSPVNTTITGNCDDPASGDPGPEVTIRVGTNLKVLVMASAQISHNGDPTANGFGCLSITPVGGTGLLIGNFLRQTGLVITGVDFSMETSPSRIQAFEGAPFLPVPGEYSFKMLWGTSLGSPTAASILSRTLVVIPL